MKPIEVRLAMRFRLESKLEGNHQYMIYKGIHMQTHERLILKGEETKSSRQKKSSLGILQEGKIYQAMQGGIGIPYMHWCGQEEDYNFLVLDELDSSFQKLLTRCGGKFSLKTALMVGIELTQILQYFHFKSYIYNNLNTKHLMLGKGQNYGKLFIIDYSKATKYRDSINQDHISEPTGNSWEMRFGNMEFSSLNYQRGLPTTRRDDMETMLYMIAYMINGELPWSHQIRNMKKNDFEKCRYVNQAKNNMDVPLFKSHPELQSLYNYTVGLKFDQKPQYAYYVSTFNKLLQKNDMLDDKMYDWMFLEEEESPLELIHKFDFYEGEEELIQKISKEIEDKKSQNIPVHQNSKIPSGVAKRKMKGDKECIIY